MNLQNNRGKTALMYSCEVENLKALKLLIENEAKIDIKDKYGRSVIDLANELKNIEIKEYLKNYSAITK